MKDWDHIISPILKEPKMADLRAFVNYERKYKEVLPKKEEVLNAFKLCPYDKLKVVIIGQDPYPNSKDAHGLSFSSKSPKTPKSLGNIFKEISAQLYCGKHDLFKSNDLTPWAEQGVLLLNRVLTVVEGASNSHKDKGWEYFTTKVIHEISEKYPRRVIFVLWGNNAKNLECEIDSFKHFVLTGVHPSPLSADKGFFGNGHFTQIQALLQQIFFESMRDLITERYDWKDLSDHIREWLQIKNISIEEENLTNTIKFVNGRIGEFIAMNDPKIRKLYEINFKT